MWANTDREQYNVVCKRFSEKMHRKFTAQTAILLLVTCYARAVIARKRTTGLTVYKSVLLLCTVFHLSGLFLDSERGRKFVGFCNDVFIVCSFFVLFGFTVNVFSGRSPIAKYRVSEKFGKWT